jgi:hypothetical protein
MVKPYTVILEYPESMTDGNFETYIAHVTSQDPESAINDAIADFEAANGYQDEAEEDKPERPLVISVFNGHLEDQAPQQPTTNVHYEG